jgi:hypothetical protein
MSACHSERSEEPGRAGGGNLMSRAAHPHRFLATFGMTAGLLVAGLTTACKSETKRLAQHAAAVPQVRATVITVQTTVAPDNKSFTHTIAIGGDRARSVDESDQWRLFDLKANTVTFVDDITKTYRTESLQSLVAKRQHALAAPLLDGTPRATIAQAHETKPLLGITVTRWTIKSGSYTRELWLGLHPAIPPQLFAMMVASDLPESPLAPMMKSVDAALLGMRGYPLADHSELPYGNKKIVIDETVSGVETKDVPASFFNVPADFKAPAANPRSAS